MANPNYILLSKATIGSAGASSITFSNIPQTGYDDLIIKTSLRGDSTLYGGLAFNVYASFNGSTSNFSQIYFETSGSGTPYTGAAPGQRMIGTYNGASSTSNTFASTDVYIPNYKSSNYKSFIYDGVSENNASTAYIDLVSGLWSNTAAITSITLAASYGNFVANSTFYLYGIANVNSTPTIGAAATGGDIIANDGTYWYHAFLSSGTFTPAKALTCDYLVVAGGGGGSYNFSSGGGAGGYRSATTQNFTSANSYTITIGAGGSGSTSGQGTSGNNSSIAGSGFTTFSATGGGRGRSDGGNGVSGGSGGGAPTGNIYTGGAGNAGVYSPVEGYKGGDTTFYTGVPRATAGGGGASAVGQNSHGRGSGLGGNGGAGSNAHSSWATATSTGASGYYAGGGGGVGESNGSLGSGGSGGGGAGSDPGGTATAGTANTGGGGGGGGNSNGNGAAGGSGIIIIRYAM